MLIDPQSTNKKESVLARPISTLLALVFIELLHKI